MFVVHGTKKFLTRVGPINADGHRVSTTSLGDWYATVLFWRPQVALFVNEVTLLPVLMLLAPAGTVAARFPATLATVLRGHGVDENFIESELGEMSTSCMDKTRNRSVVGMMTEFSFLADAFRDSDPPDLTALSIRLAGTPCGPLYRRHVSPDRELRAFVDGISA